MPYAIIYQRDPEKHRVRSSNYYWRNHDKCLQAGRHYRMRNRKVLSGRAKKYYRSPGRKEYQRAYVKHRYHNDSEYRARCLKDAAIRQNKNKKKIREFLNALKSSTPCADCKNKFRPECMDFDHLPGKKKIRDIAQMCSGWVSLRAIKQEIKKCELVCACCHRTRTQNRRAKS